MTCSSCGKVVDGDYHYSCRKCGMTFCEKCNFEMFDGDICEDCSDEEFDEEFEEDIEDMEDEEEEDY